MTDSPTPHDLQLFRRLFDEMPQLGWTARADGYIDFYNRGWYQYTGTTFEEMEGWGWTSVHDPVALEAVADRWKKAIESGSEFEMEFRLRRHDGAYRWFITRARPLRDDDGNITRWVGINTDVTIARELQRSLDDERVNLRELFELAPAFMAKLRQPEHTFEVVNPAYMRLIGEGRQVLGLPVREALPEVAGQGFFELLDNVYQSGIPFIGNAMRIELAGEEKYLDFVYQVTRDTAGQINGIFVHGTDVTIQVRARQMVEEQSEALRQASQMKDEFLATLSHELRTPMTAVLGWARLLKMGLDSGETAIAIDAIEQSAEAQAQLIEDVLDVSRITSGKFTFSPRPVDLGTVTRAAITTVHPAAAARNIEILTSFPPLIPPIAGDEGRLQQVVWNLLANAVKFTPKGGSVVVRITHTGSTLQLSVRDTGAGIDPAFLPHLFEPFRQADSSSTRAQGGIGLGLAIVRKIVELHGGSVTARSEGLGHGALFIVELPILETRPTNGALSGAPAESRPGRPSGDVPLLAGATILVIDDQDYTREVATAILRRTTATVYSASSVREGLALFDEHAPDIVICDIAMPGENGYVFVQEVRALTGERSRTPIIALTAYGRPEDRQLALETGFTDYLKKPVEPLMLAATVQRLLGR